MLSVHWLLYCGAQRVACQPSAQLSLALDWVCTAFQLYPGPLSAGGDVHVHGLRASVPLKTSKRVCSSPPAWWLVDLLVQCSAYFGCAELPSYWVVNHLAFLHLQKFIALFLHSVQAVFGMGGLHWATAVFGKLWDFAQGGLQSWAAVPPS